MKYFLLRVAAILSPVFAAALVLSPAQAAPFTVFNLRPTQTFVNAYTEILVDFNSSSPAIDHCRLSVNGVNQGAMNLTAIPNGTAYKVHFFSSAGTYTVRVTCYDAMETSSSFEEESVTVLADSAAPSLSAIYYSQTTLTTGTPVNISVNYNDTESGSGMQGCTLFINGASQGTMTLSGGAQVGTATKSHTFSTAGSYTVRVNCMDRSWNEREQDHQASVIAATDAAPPNVGPVSYGSLFLNTPILFQASVSDNVGVTTCNLNINGAHDGSMTISGGLAQRHRTFTAAGTYTASVRCFDASGNSTEGPTATFTFGAAPDTAQPAVGTPYPATATAGSAVNISASFSDNVGVTSCDLYVNDVIQGPMSLSGTSSGTATRSHTFATNGTYLVRLNCYDAAGNSRSAFTHVGVSVAPSATPYANRIVKLVCPTGFIDVNHPCKAVYYVGSDGRRHAFPNERIFFTWYANFDGIIELDGAALSAVPLGSNVSYRPGIRMLKFTTINKVYAVGRYGQLRWVTSEDIARTLYGSDWNRKIDDLSDAFFTDYTFGSDIASVSDFSPMSEAATAATIDANLR